MSEAPEVTAAKAKLRQLVTPAVDALEDLLSSEHAGIRLGASKEILDRGGVPAKHEMTNHIEIGLDDEIESLLHKVKDQITQRNKKSDPELDIEDAVVLEDAPELTVGEQAASLIGVPLDDQVAEAEVEDENVAWWQSNPAPLAAEVENTL